MSYNRFKQAKNESPKAFDKYLDDSREKTGTSPDAVTTEVQLKKDHDEADGSKPFNKLLEKARKGTREAVIEKVMEQEGAHRTDKYYKTTVNPLAIQVEAREQNRRDEFLKAQNAQDRDTDFWDKKVGSQMIGEKTKQVANKQKSQLQNNPDRFYGLEGVNALGGTVKDIEKAKGKEVQIDKMVTASLKDADAMLFQIFATAAAEGREISQTEQQIVTDINASKVRLIAAQVAALGN
ncbi:MAG: hypothetical protein HC888_01735 [Candidatus Competibacteraceae bacterium]|nr:hypothetical protein [Candidatus Competibacteraceae bacterium]